MSRSLMLSILGAMVALAPFSGLPLSILTWVLPIIGLIVLSIGISYKREQAHTEHQTHEASLSASS